LNAEEAVRACEFWTTSPAGNQAYGTTLNPQVGAFFGGDEYQPERWTQPHRRGWAISIPRYTPAVDQDTRTENPLYQLVVAEIDRRKG